MTQATQKPKQKLPDKRPPVGYGHMIMADELAAILNKQTLGAKFHGVHVIRDLIEKAWMTETGKPLPAGLPHKAFIRIDY